MYDLPSQENVEEVIVDIGAVKGHSQPIVVYSKNHNKAKSVKTSAA
jgi:ATP-dependent Clp protease ATP-binding subunit ClpX